MFFIWLSKTMAAPTIVSSLLWFRGAASIAQDLAALREGPCSLYVNYRKSSWWGASPPWPRRACSWLWRPWLHSSKYPGQQGRHRLAAHLCGPSQSSTPSPLQPTPPSLFFPLRGFQLKHGHKQNYTHSPLLTGVSFYIFQAGAWIERIVRVGACRPSKILKECNFGWGT